MSPQGQRSSPDVSHRCILRQDGRFGVQLSGYRDGRLFALRHGSYASARSADPFIEVVQEAMDRTGMNQVPVTDRAKLLGDNGPGYG